MTSLPFRINLFTLFYLFLLVSSANASLLEFSGTPQKTIAEIPVYAQAKVNLADVTAQVYATGAGILIKDDLFVAKNYYVAVSYIDSNTAVDPKAPLESVKASKLKAIQLTVLQDTNAQEIRAQFQMALQKNGVDLDSPAVQALLQKFDMVLPARTSVNLVGYKNGAVEEVAIELPGGVQPQQSDVELSLSFWKMWFGVPSNDRMQSLKTDLIGPMH